MYIYGMNADFMALLRYKARDEGGRSRSAKSGYRPAIQFAFSEMTTTGQQIFVGRDWVHPGESVYAHIKIISTDYFREKLYEGIEFEFKEGPIVIGTGRVIEIFNEGLRRKE